eukprot:Phypoly_transcript_26592.p1 GENE.Phypoly_transcript_26592~~Phypoly_transcript_26592.p1  ORF type:complete len:117 (+),score=8.50 Phypoly_transcript_26592:1-351(+)
MKVVLTKVGFNPNIQITPKGGTVLHWIIQVCQLPRYVEAVAKRANVNAIDKDGKTPLHLAAKSKHPDVVSILVNLGADLNAKDNDGNRPVDCIPSDGSYTSQKMTEAFVALEKRDL